MIKRSNELRIAEYPGHYLIHIKEKETFGGHGRLFAKVIIKPGEEIAYHVHSHETETYYILSGHGLYNDNGVQYELLPGDAAFVADGEGHGIRNMSDSDLVFLVLVISV